MGGYGSGRRWSSKEITSDYFRLDVRLLQRKGFLLPGRSATLTWSRNGQVIGKISVQSDANALILSYRHRRNGGDWQNALYPVSVEWTRCNYGGSRAWFRCPTRGCGRRVAVLYGGSIFACRNCHQLAYDTQRESVNDRALHRAQAIRMRLGGSANMFEPFPEKPKGMHWRTYDRLFSQAEEAQRRSWPEWFMKKLAADMFP